MTGPIRLLICEDSDDDAVLIAAGLRRGGLDVEFERADTARSMADALRLRPPDIVLSDYSMPGFGAEDALRLLRDSGLDVPFIIVSGRIGEESAVTLMRAGAHDFILKSQTARLVPAVRRELRQAQIRRKRREAEAALRTSEQRFRLFAEHTPDVMFRYRVLPSAEVEYFSRAAGTVLGYLPGELCGDPANVFSRVSPQDRPSLEASWRSPGSEPLVVRWLRRDGSEAWTEQRAVGLRDDRGRIVAVEGILRDITERVASDAHRDRLQQQLRQAERLESLGRLAGGIAHDFNNLLAVILGHTDLMLAELPQDSPSRPGLELVRHLTSRGAALTRQLLVFSRQEPLRPETLDVNEVVADTERVLRGAVGEDVEFVTVLAPGLRPVTIDHSELERLLLNLVANSRRAMPDGGRLTIETSNVEVPPTESGGGELIRELIRLCVTDTGIGMSEAVARHAFEPFFTTEPDVGTGLGLSTAYGVVKGAGGEISLTSQPGVGTVVRIDLPAAEHATAAKPRSEHRPAGGNGETVLVVEDDDDVRDMVALMLRRSGYRVIEAPSPVEAVIIARTAQPLVDVLLTDVVMPGMSGIELAAHVREAMPAIPILLMSGHTAGSLPGEAVLPSGTTLIRKPFTMAALLRSLNTILGRNS
jgi:two-component system, cell cycle sensor histidine kinase and response regulator CckA